VTSADKLLKRMSANPRDWRIEDVVAVCRANGVECTPPQRGSHYKVKHASMDEILTIPARRPIKPVYVRDLVRFLDAVRKASG
jgi:predicted RNA binding protein YcfA (HicA-like mRNA interferase family)